jgi:hypothetical protein
LTGGHAAKSCASEGDNPCLSLQGTIWDTTLKTPVVWLSQGFVEPYDPARFDYQKWSRALPEAQLEAAAHRGNVLPMRRA